MITAPGAPFTGFAAPESTPPRPSPIHQTPSAQAIEAGKSQLQRRSPRDAKTNGYLHQGETVESARTA